MHKIWIYTEPGVEKLCTVVDPKMIDSSISLQYHYTSKCPFAARFNKADAFEERRLREW